jgi:hypothetical protein
MNKGPVQLAANMTAVFSQTGGSAGVKRGCLCAGNLGTEIPTGIMGRQKLDRMINFFKGRLSGEITKS